MENQQKTWKILDLVKSIKKFQVTKKGKKESKLEVNQSRIERAQEKLESWNQLNCRLLLSQVQGLKIIKK